MTLSLFAVSAISGAALFFHAGKGVFHGMHEWLSMILLAPFALHVWKNWTPLIGYLRRRTLLVPVAVSLVAALAFAVPALCGTGRDDPPFRAIQLLADARLADLAPVPKTTPDALQAGLRQRGYPVGSADDTLGKIAASAGVPAARVLFSVLPAP
jgi:hypothetical protein